ncbi:hypothetical protein ABGB17_05990 [Sphaerisporangium sp. B11E5]|uniref:hypothetical protein n=1 Tax=Sphaerisporangium sp. B11E5 TaxID=3153563 RepID=UPI00325D62B6
MDRPRTRKTEFGDSSFEAAVGGTGMIMPLNAPKPGETIGEFTETFIPVSTSDYPRHIMIIEGNPAAP